MIPARDLPVRWRKSSYSSNNNGACVEIGDLSSVAWTKSRHSTNGGDCLEWAPTRARTGAVPIRDSKNPEGPALLLPAPAWTAFLRLVATPGD
ncbi:DUF397 domain-containing protein [Streptomyces mobaraensis]|uniref:DUF397 domain-containing protein n=1 Tax=Streptomyces mobaraensis TaxID=35621 RepID=A0A5N5WCT9_STRMB|nr:DUF397 domain-containing protein [Streptomyces mobaraensis]KAB7849994.1 DUF397 domain-containing protein [Streptomyces mobaraensis]